MILLIWVFFSQKENGLFYINNLLKCVELASLYGVFHMSNLEHVFAEVDPENVSDVAELHCKVEDWAAGAATNVQDFSIGRQGKQVRSEKL